jgi:hypothetical protein
MFREGLVREIVFLIATCILVGCNNEPTNSSSVQQISAGDELLRGGSKEFLEDGFKFEVRNDTPQTIVVALLQAHDLKFLSKYVLKSKKMWISSCPVEKCVVFALSEVFGGRSDDEIKSLRYDKGASNRQGIVTEKAVKLRVINNTTDLLFVEHVKD